jgi:DNA-damage-inducible protein J
MGLPIPRIAEERRPPFAAEVPNAATRRAMDVLETGKGHRAGSVDAMFEELGI